MRGNRSKLAAARKSPRCHVNTPLDSYQDGDYSGILLRLEYLNRIIINFGDLPDSVVAGIGSAITCLSCAQCKMGLTGLHDSPARVQNSLFIVWLSRVCL